MNVNSYVVQGDALTVERFPEHSSAQTTPPSTMRHHRMAKYPNIPRVRACAMLTIKFCHVGARSEELQDKSVSGDIVYQQHAKTSTATKMLSCDEQPFFFA
jgi:hypothetical protein